MRTIYAEYNINHDSIDVCRLPSKTAICAMFGGQCVT